MSSQTKQLLIMAGIFIVVIGLLFWLGGESGGGGTSGGYTAPKPQPAAAPSEPAEPVEAADLEAAAEDAAEAAAEEAAAQMEEDRQNAADAVTQALEEQSQQIEAIADLEVELDPEQEAADAAAADQAGLVGLDAGENQIANQATTVQDLFDQAEVPADAPQPIEPENAVISNTAYTASLEIRCDALLANMADLAAEKQAIVPADGLVLATKQITFYEGESVFNVLERELKQAAIHLEFVNTPFYNSAYIEGIANLYEFDCGEGSGWVYQVNDWFPNYGASRYQLQDGDTIIWHYTCDLGLDVGRGL